MSGIRIPKVWQSVREMSAATEVWHEILDRAPDQANTVSMNRTIPEEIMRRLATNEDWRVRDSAIGLRRPSADILAMLAHDEHDAVRSTVATHPSTRIETLETMRDDPWDFIRETVAARLRPEKSPGEAPQV